MTQNEDEVVNPNEAEQSALLKQVSHSQILQSIVSENECALSCDSSQSDVFYSEDENDEHFYHSPTHDPLVFKDLEEDNFHAVIDDEYQEEVMEDDEGFELYTYSAEDEESCSDNPFTDYSSQVNTYKSGKTKLNRKASSQVNMLVETDSSPQLQESTFHPFVDQTPNSGFQEDDEIDKMFSRVLDTEVKEDSVSEPELAHNLDRSEQGTNNNFNAKDGDILNSGIENSPSSMKIDSEKFEVFTPSELLSPEKAVGTAADKPELTWKATSYDAIFNRLGDSVFSGNSKHVYEPHLNLHMFRIQFKYTCISESRNINFMLDDVIDSGNFKIKLSGNPTVKPTATKILLLYANSDRQILEFKIVPSKFDPKPRLAYKIYYSGTFVRIPTPLKFRRRLRILSLDNSENLGTSIIATLYLLEKHLNEVKQKESRLTDYFDFICGTGTGALIALCLLKGYTIKELRTQWQIIISGLFKWNYSLPSGLIFDRYYTEEFKSNWVDILGTDFMITKPEPLCMITCTNVKSNPYELFLFRNYGDSSLGTVKSTPYAPMWLAGWSSCALPTYVRGPSGRYLNDLGYQFSDKVHLVDGSFVCTSPGLVALQELSTLYNVGLRSLIDDHLDLFISIGANKDESDAEHAYAAPV
ncbi:hypothetical protein BEWA_042620 [Theileria equi strain WA]|uniref:PNPLA domain-containing protein n=1 Tax=Theileria equi strain WA TaxID=1537102 RepID=L1LG31_THEEQ|nr:hypothetical protein BEWA_042620 [Theileria equi strain WA]EKX74224.1 hypothetical protein BEWA_042620 [Theileria equi strain WA]|eukprot:XP_004833676.1 hypothetical protein BEWA_042620 [Theileria equi strain WA]